MARSDPNNIFNALTKRLVTLELNQTLINNWLSLWQAQISSKFKAINATLDESSRRLRVAQTELASVASIVQVESGA